MKPSLGSYQGIGAFRLELTDINGPEDLKTRLADCGGNFVVQELIEQADLLSSLNPSSVNIIRMNTVCLNGNAFLANASIRFGVAGSVTDMAYVKGVEIARVAGLSDDGCLRSYFCNQDGDRIPLSELGIQGGGNRVPGFDKAVSCCKELHKQMHHFGLVAFDVAIRSDGEPVIVELNIDGPGSVFYQYANGPFFGDHTEDVIEWCKEQTWNPALNIQII